MPFTEQELITIARLLDTAVRANGLAAAKDALPIVQKIETELRNMRAVRQGAGELA